MPTLMGPTPQEHLDLLDFDIPLFEMEDDKHHPILVDSGESPLFAEPGLSQFEQELYCANSNSC